MAVSGTRLSSNRGVIQVASVALVLAHSPLEGYSWLGHISGVDPVFRWGVLMPAVSDRFVSLRGGLTVPIEPMLLIFRLQEQGFALTSDGDVLIVQPYQRLPPMYQAIVTMAYYTGWRINSEILTLEWRQIDRQACVIRLEPGSTKNGRGRTFTYAELIEVKAAVDGLWARHEALERGGTLTPLVFCRRKGQAIRTFWKRWKRQRRAGCPGRVPHDFRRTAVRNLNRAGVPESVAMKITGHLTRSVFDRYDITSEEDLAEASRKLQALTGTIAGTKAITDAEALQERWLSL